MARWDYGLYPSIDLFNAGVTVKRVLLLISISGCIFSLPLSAQSTSTPQALLLEASHAFAGNQPVSSVLLTGNANFVAGGTRTNGSISLTARADGSSDLEFSAGSASRNELQDTFANGQGCTWSVNGGITHTAAGQNCVLPFAWFLPQAALFSSDLPTSGTFALTAPSNVSGQTVLQWLPQLPANFSAEQSALVSHAGSNELYFDNSSVLPTELRYAAHPDTNAALDIPVRILYSDYRSVDGAEIPFRIQRYFNGVLTLDITIDYAVITR